MLSKSVATLGHNCVTFDDGDGRKWHVPYDDLIGIPRVGDHVLLPNPPDRPERFVVVGVQHAFMEQDVPPGTTGWPPSRGNGKWIYVQLNDVNVTVELIESQLENG